MIRQFTLINEYGQTYSLTDLHKGFLTNPAGLGYSLDRQYTRFGSEWIRSDDGVEQTAITGTAYFRTYAEAHAFVEFVMQSQALTLAYQTDAGIYYKDVDINKYEKGEIGETGFLACNIEMIPTTLWYLPNNLKYRIEHSANTGLRFTFTLPNQWQNYTNGTITIVNDGHVPAPFKCSISGPISNPSIILSQNGEDIARLEVTDDIASGSTLEYSSKDGNIYLYVVDSQGNKTDLATTLDITNTNIFKIPVGTYQLQIEADSQLTTAVFTIYKQYIAV